MRDNVEINVRTGAVEAPVTDAPSRLFTARWDVPVFSGAEKDRFIESLASDALLAGRWVSGLVTEQDRLAAHATEEDWKPSCTCGKFQPCRHAVSVMFRVREQAKADAWLWLAVRGIVRDETFITVHQERIRKLQPQTIIENTRTVFEEADDFPLLMHAEDPPFWNRDVSFADWLRHIYAKSRKGEVSR